MASVQSVLCNCGKAVEICAETTPTLDQTVRFKCPGCGNVMNFKNRDMWEIGIPCPEGSVKGEII